MEKNFISNVCNFIENQQWNCENPKSNATIYSLLEPKFQLDYLPVSVTMLIFDISEI